HSFIARPGSFAGTSMDRLKTHVEGFDEALGGGIPRGSIVLVAGTPGTMKTALTFSILYENVKAGSKALYISLEESQEDLRASMTELGETDVQLRMRCVKMRRTRHEHGYYALIRNNGKFQITRAISE